MFEGAQTKPNQTRNEASRSLILENPTVAARVKALPTVDNALQLREQR
jgi:hypothetical protein